MPNIRLSDAVLPSQMGGPHILIQVTYIRSLICPAFKCVPWLIHMFVYYDSFICIHMCTMTHSYVRHDVQRISLCMLVQVIYISLYADSSHSYWYKTRDVHQVTYITLCADPSHIYWYMSLCWSKSHILIQITCIRSLTSLCVLIQVTYITLCADPSHIYWYMSLCWSKSHILVQITCIRSLTSLYMLIQVTYISINADASLLYWCKQVTCIRSLTPL